MAAIRRGVFVSREVENSGATQVHVSSMALDRSQAASSQAGVNERDQRNVQGADCRLNMQGGKLGELNPDEPRHNINPLPLH